MLGAAAHQAGVASPQLQIGAVEHIFRSSGSVSGGKSIDFHLPNAAARSGDSQEAGLMRGVLKPSTIHFVDGELLLPGFGDRAIQPVQQRHEALPLAPHQHHRD